MITVINTQDTAWAVDHAAHPPSKESSWSFPMSDDGWIHAHNALRGELSDLIDAIKAMDQRNDHASELAIKSIQASWKEHVTHMHAHHGNEDDVLMPYLQTRIKLPEKLTSDHKTIVDLMNQVGEILDNLKEGVSLLGVLQAMIAYEETLRPHLEEEESICLPLLRAYFEPEELEPLMKKVMSKSPDIELGSFIYYMGKEDFRQKFMKTNKIPFFVWYLVFQSRYNYYAKHFKENVDSLKNGEKIVSSNKFSSCNVLWSWLEQLLHELFFRTRK